LASESVFGLRKPTVIQGRTIKLLVGAKVENNLFIQSETGSGKTLAYLLPIVQSLAMDKSGALRKISRLEFGTRCIILSPTRELAVQTFDVALKLCRSTFSWIVPGYLGGGENRKSEKSRLRKGLSVVISTPGRLLDHLNKTECLNAALKVEWIVLDEVDRLLDMGLGDQVGQIITHLRGKQRKLHWRSILVSATVSKAIEDLAKKVMGGESWKWVRANKVIKEKVDQENKEEFKFNDATPKQLAQVHMIVTSKLRLSALIAFLVPRVKQEKRIIIFLSTCASVDYHHKLFTTMDSILDKQQSQTGIFGNCCSFHYLHGNIPQSERHPILRNFSKPTPNTSSILITTDVAARGLNINDVDWIIQYDPPCETADYVHRAGRAARAGKAGHAILFLLPSERKYIEILELRGLKKLSALSLASTLAEAAKLCDVVTGEGLEKSTGGYGGRPGEAFAGAVQSRMEECIVRDEIARKEDNKKGGGSGRKGGDLSRLKNSKKNQVGLLVLAQQAFTSYLRAYPAKEKAVRHIFSPRALHLGHVARSFALKEGPKKLVKASYNSKKTKEKPNKRISSLAFVRKQKT